MTLRPPSQQTETLVQPRAHGALVTQPATQAIWPRTSLRLRLGAGIAAMFITGVLVASQLGIASMYSGEAEALLAKLKSGVQAAQVAMAWARAAGGI